MIQYQVQFGDCVILKRLYRFILLSIPLFAAGCIDLNAVGRFFGSEDSRVAPEAEVAATYVGEPKVRNGLVISITVSAAGTEAYQSKEYRVDSEGKILMPLIGAVKCDGLSLVELSDKIAGMYREYLQDPQITAVFVYASGSGMISPWGTVTVLGEVGRPGPVDIPSTQDLTVTRALQLAGGSSSLADNKRVQVSHCDKDGKITKTRVNLVEIGREGRVDKDIRLSAGDVIWVPMSYY